MGNWEQEGSLQICSPILKCLSWKTVYQINAYILNSAIIYCIKSTFCLHYIMTPIQDLQKTVVERLNSHTDTVNRRFFSQSCNKKIRNIVRIYFKGDLCIFFQLKILS